MNIIDSHIHFWNPRLLHYERKAYPLVKGVRRLIQSEGARICRAAPGYEGTGRLQL